MQCTLYNWTSDLIKWIEKEIKHNFQEQKIGAWIPTIEKKKKYFKQYNFIGQAIIWKASAIDATVAKMLRL